MASLYPWRDSSPGEAALWIPSPRMGGRRTITLWMWSLLGVAAAFVVSPTLWALFVDWGWAAGEGAAGDKAFLKVLRRALTVGILLPWLIGLRPWRDVPPSAIGLVGPRARPSSGWMAFAIAMGMVAVFFGLRALGGWTTWRAPTDPVAQSLYVLRVLLVPALLVASIEEPLFRGWLETRWTRKRWGPWTAACAVSAIYAFIHAFRPTRVGIPVERTIGGGVAVAGDWIAGAFDPNRFLPAFVGLMLFGLLLSAAYRRSGTIWTSVGIHAAAIAVMQTHERFFTHRPAPFGMGGARIYEHWPCWVLLACTTWWLARPCGPRLAGEP